MKKILVTGAAGFIGYHTSRKLCAMGWDVLGIDSLNSYDDSKLQDDRLAQLESFENFTFRKVNISDKSAFDKLFTDYKISIIINLAARAGVRNSIKNPYQYIASNIDGFANVLEAARHNKVEHLLFASSSSVYGANNKLPFRVNDNTDRPVSLYAATKKANEAMAYSYASLYNIPTTALRFFTVYGPWGRPDMAYFTFTQKILNREPIHLYNYGQMRRDFTYIDDLVWAIAKLINIPPGTIGQQMEITEPHAPYTTYNIGSHSPVVMNDFVSILENLLGIKAVTNGMPMQPGDMLETYADVSGLELTIGKMPNTDITIGLKSFVDWYKDYYG